MVRSRLRLLLPLIAGALTLTACDTGVDLGPETDPGDDDPDRLAGHGSDSTRYEVVPIPTPGDAFGRAYGINDDGVVVGMFEVDGDPRAFRLADGTFEELAGLGGSVSAAYAINAEGAIVGEAEDAAGDLRAVAWIDGEVVDLGTLGGATSQAVAVNDGGRVVGRAQDAGGTYRPFLWAQGRMEALPLPPGEQEYTYASADGINEDGDVVGTVREETGQRALLWSGDRLTVLETECGTAAASDINDLGQIVGSGTACPISPAVGVPLLWDGEREAEYLEPLGGLTRPPSSPTLQNGGDAVAINRWGEIVGWSSLRPDDYGAVRATLWYRDAVVNLGGDPGSGRLRFAGAADVNEEGVAVGVSAETPVIFRAESEADLLADRGSHEVAITASGPPPAGIASDDPGTAVGEEPVRSVAGARVGSRAGEDWAVRLCGPHGSGRVSGLPTLADLLAGCEERSR